MSVASACYNNLQRNNHGRSCENFLAKYLDLLFLAGYTVDEFYYALVLKFRAIECLFPHNSN
jgi:hypothetical protein